MITLEISIKCGAEQNQRLLHMNDPKSYIDINALTKIIAITKQHITTKAKSTIGQNTFYLVDWKKEKKKICHDCINNILYSRANLPMWCQCEEMSMNNENWTFICIKRYDMVYGTYPGFKWSLVVCTCGKFNFPIRVKCEFGSA